MSEMTEANQMPVSAGEQLDILIKCLPDAPFKDRMREAVSDLRAQLAAAESEEERWMKEAVDQRLRADNWKKTAESNLRQLEAANKRPEEAEKREPFGYLHFELGRNMPEFHFKKSSHEGMKAVYSEPIPPADVAELQRTIEKLREGVKTIPEYMQMVQEQRQRIAELERKLAENQAYILKLGNAHYENFTVGADEAFTELNNLLSEAREEGRKDAVPDGLLDRLTRHVVVGEDDSKWVELCDIEAALAL